MSVIFPQTSYRFSFILVLKYILPRDRKARKERVSLRRKRCCFLFQYLLCISLVSIRPVPSCFETGQTVRWNCCYSPSVVRCEGGSCLKVFCLRRTFGPLIPARRLIEGRTICTSLQISLLIFKVPSCLSPKHLCQCGFCGAFRNGEHGTKYAEFHRVVHD